MSKFDLSGDDSHTADTVISSIEKHLSKAENRTVSHKMGKAEMNLPFILKNDVLEYVREFLSITKIHITWEARKGQGCLGTTKLQLHWTTK
jgi:hypothetical protein